MSLATNALTTLARLKAFLDVTITPAQDDVLENIIHAASEFIRSYCRRTFKRTAYSSEMYDGQDHQTLILDNYPVDSGETFTLQMRTSAINEDRWETIESQYYFPYYPTGIIEFPKAPSGEIGRKFILGNKNYRVTFTAGYYLPQDGSFTEGGSTSLPADLEYACWKLCSAAWNSRRGDPNVKSERIGIYSVTFTKTAFESPEIMAILDKYAKRDYIS